MYRPLPDNLTIKKSNVEGLGLFTTENVEVEHIFGVTHIQNTEFENGYITSCVYKQSTILFYANCHRGNPSCRLQTKLYN